MTYSYRLIKHSWNPKPIMKCVLFFFSMILLVPEFYSNSWGIADHSWFENNLQFMEGPVIGRMQKTRQDGTFSAGGLLGEFNTDTVDHSFWSDSACLLQKRYYQQGLARGDFKVYESQIGGQGLVLSLFDKHIDLSPQMKVSLYHAFSAMASAFLISVILIWFYSEFGLFTFLFLLLTSVISMWLSVFARNIFWMLWVFYLPMVVLMFYYKLKYERGEFKIITPGILVFISILIKCFFNGYEYITTALIMMAVPLFYYAIRDKWSINRLFGMLGISVLASFLAIMISLIILCVQIKSVTGSFNDGVKHIVSSFERRSYGNPADFSKDYTASLQANVGSILKYYVEGAYVTIKQPKFLEPKFNYRGITVTYKMILTICLISIITLLLLYCQLKYDDNNKAKALILSTILSLAAPLSWFVIFKAHSQIHGHMNYIIWQMPFTFFAFAIISFSIQKIVKATLEIKKRRRASS